MAMYDLASYNKRSGMEKKTSNQVAAPAMLNVYVMNGLSKKKITDSPHLATTVGIGN